MNALIKRIKNSRKCIFSALILVFLFISCKPEEINKESPDLPPTSANQNIKILKDNFEGKEILIVGNAGGQFIVSFINDLGLSFEVLQAELPVIMIDNEGTRWDIFGIAVNGDRKGQQLKMTNSMMAYWFSVGAFFPGIELYGQNTANIDFTPQNPSDGWLVSSQNIYSGAVKDAIPALDEPTFLNYTERAYLNSDFYLENNDLVLGIRVNNQIRLYSHAILNWHEIVNDSIEGEQIAIIYCPLTGTAGAWNRTINGETTTFGVSGLLYNNNLIPYDRLTNSLWSQIRQDCINGEQIGGEVQTFQLVETTFKMWEEMYGELTILSPETGISRDYTQYPYGDYKKSALIPFPVSYLDKRLHPKERVHAVIINQKAKAYRFTDFN